MKITKKTNRTLAFCLNSTGARNRLTVYKLKNKKKIIKIIGLIYGCHCVLCFRINSLAKFHI